MTKGQSDTHNRRGTKGFSYGGSGMHILMKCFKCNTPASTAGGKRVGRLKLFHCAPCVATTAGAAA